MTVPMNFRLAYTAKYFVACILFSFTIDARERSFPSETHVIDSIQYQEQRIIAQNSGVSLSGRLTEPRSEREVQSDRWFRLYHNTVLGLLRGDQRVFQDGLNQLVLFDERSDSRKATDIVWLLHQATEAQFCTLILICFVIG